MKAFSLDAEILRGTLERLIRYFLLLIHTANYEFQAHSEGDWFIFHQPMPGSDLLFGLRMNHIFLEPAGTGV